VKYCYIIYNFLTFVNTVSLNTGTHRGYLYKIPWHDREYHAPSCDGRRYAWVV